MYFQGEIQIALFKDASFYLDRHVDAESTCADAESSGIYLKVTLCGHYNDIISLVWIILGLYIYTKKFYWKSRATTKFVQKVNGVDR